MARKPCASGSTTANVVEHQAGALNVDACRVVYQSEADKTPTVGKGEFHREEGVGAEFPHHKEGWGQWKVNHGGRWPSNVLLVHRPGCEVVGTRKVATGVAVRRNVGHSTKGLISYARGTKDAEMRDDVSYAEADGKETVPDWRCEPGCPVAALDRQSGTLTSGTGAVKRASSADGHGNRGAAYGSESRAEGTPMVCYGDTGGASRFFKGFGGAGSGG